MNFILRDMHIADNRIIDENPGQVRRYRVGTEKFIALQQGVI